jgi:thioredoxin 1
VSTPARNVVVAIALVGLALAFAACGGEQAAGPTPSASGAGTPPAGAPLVTFVELGSDNCIPCREMRPVMDVITRDYAPDVLVVFYDVYERGDMAERYGVRVIPTQVFLDESGKEFYRHEGFLPREAIEELLAERGITKAGT